MRARHGLNRPLPGALRGMAGLRGARRIRLLAGLQRRRRPLAATAHSGHAAAHRHGNAAGMDDGSSARHLECRGPRQLGRSNDENGTFDFTVRSEYSVGSGSAFDCRGDRLAAGGWDVFARRRLVERRRAGRRPLTPPGHSGCRAGVGHAARPGPSHTGECGRCDGRALRARRACAGYPAQAPALPAHSSGGAQSASQPVRPLAGHAAQRFPVGGNAGGMARPGPAVSGSHHGARFCPGAGRSNEFGGARDRGESAGRSAALPRRSKNPHTWTRTS